jgi:D-glycero-alpha-D-manno-heptose 1-phosphate guanylyltransferase
VLCGGLGTRLRSVLSDRPKSMALVGGRPFLQLLVEQIQAQGIGEVILGTGYLAEQIEQHFGDGANFGLAIGYSREQTALGTGGAVKLAEPKLSDPALILNGDSYVDWQLPPMIALAEKEDADLVMALQPVPEISRYGSVHLDDSGRITHFAEKGEKSGAGLINAGVYLLRKQVIADLPADRAISLERDVFPQLLRGRVFGVVSDGNFIDIGIPEDLARAQTLLA